MNHILTSKNRLAIAATCLAFACKIGCGGSKPGRILQPTADGEFHVYEGENIQDAIEAAAENNRAKIVRVHPGVYRPAQHGQALVWFNRRHDGIKLIAEGDVTLTAANEAISDKSHSSYPAVVNHVLYFGDGVSSETEIRGFRVTGANNFVTQSDAFSIEPNQEPPRLDKGLFFFADGGGIKVFGRSYPTIAEMEIVDNYVSPCGGGVSIEHQGFNQDSVTISDCVFRNNRCQITGSGVDVLPGSSALITTCLFVSNVSNTGPNYVGGPDNPYNEEHGSGALTVFPTATVKVDRCTFTGNWNGAER